MTLKARLARLEKGRRARGAHAAAAAPELTEDELDAMTEDELRNYLHRPRPEVDARLAAMTDAELEESLAELRAMIREEGEGPGPLRPWREKVGRWIAEDMAAIERGDVWAIKSRLAWEKAETCGAYALRNRILEIKAETVTDLREALAALMREEGDGWPGAVREEARAVLADHAGGVTA